MVNIKKIIKPTVGTILIASSSFAAAWQIATQNNDLEIIRLIPMDCIPEQEPLSTKPLMPEAAAQEFLDRTRWETLDCSLKEGCIITYSKPPYKPITYRDRPTYKLDLEP